jgi:Zinc knuckle
MHPSRPFCYFCGEPGHIQVQCKSCMEYLTTGRCELAYGCVVLPSGSEILHEVYGHTLKERVDNWHMLCTNAARPPPPMLSDASSLPQTQASEPEVPVLHTQTHSGCTRPFPDHACALVVNAEWRLDADEQQQLSKALQQAEDLWDEICQKWVKGGRVCTSHIPRLTAMHAGSNSIHSGAALRAFTSHRLSLTRVGPPHYASHHC